MSLRATFSQMRRRFSWFPRRPKIKATTNLGSSILHYSIQSDRAAMMPPMVKIDISPLCALACPSCLHADKKGRERNLLDRQSFNKSQRMSLSDFEAIIFQLKGRSMAISLYYYGDPLMHPKFPEMVSIAVAADLSVHASTHLSYNLSDEKIISLVSSGLTHLSVAVDGATQQTYGTTRVRGNLDLVLKNLERIKNERLRQKSVTPFIEVQHLSFPHHEQDEADRVEKMVYELGVDQFTTFPGALYDVDGDLYNAVDTDRGASSPGAAKGHSLLPRCHWPWSSTVIKFDGDVIPCCKWREGHQYAVGGDIRAVGNVFRDRLEDIWKGAAYRSLRRQVRNPRVSQKYGEAENSFCEGCPKLYDTPSPLGQWQPG